MFSEAQLKGIQGEMKISKIYGGWPRVMTEELEELLRVYSKYALTRTYTLRNELARLRAALAALRQQIDGAQVTTFMGSAGHYSMFDISFTQFSVGQRVRIIPSRQRAGVAARVSYEGTVEFICTRGHLFSCDCNDESDGPKCGYGHAAAWRHSIDYTNGEDLDDPNCCKAPVRAVSREDHWHQDHYGNLYATQEELVEPVGPEWARLVP